MAAIDGGVVLEHPDGSTRRLTTVAAAPPLAWAPDGSAIAFRVPSGEAAGIYVVTLNGVARRLSTSFATALAWLPGRLFIGEPGVIDPDTGAEVQRFPNGISVAAIAPDARATALEETSGTFGYEGTDLYLADAHALHQHRLSPTRCPDIVPGRAAHCQEGSDGADRLIGTPLSDALFGGAGNDTIIGAAKADFLEGSFGADVISGGGGNDVIHGQVGSDRISGGDGIDIIDGGSGNDTIVGGPGRDFVFGGPGDDTIIATDGGWHDTIDCGPGLDTVRADPLDEVDLSNCERVIRVRPITR